MGRRRKIEEIDGYLRISVKPGHQAFPGEDLQISRINEICSRKELYFTRENDLICAYLSMIDPDPFLKILTDLGEETGTTAWYQSQGFSNPFDQIMKQILSIGSYGIRYGKRIYIGYSDERKVVDRKEKSSTRGVHFYTQGHEFSRVNNPFPSKKLNTIAVGDSGELLGQLPENCVDLIITSPPYNFGMDYHKTDDGVDWNAYLDKLFNVFTEGIRVLKYGGRFIINVQPLFSDYIPLHHLISSFFIDKKMIWKGEILWEKNNYNCKYTSWGSWKSPSSPYLKYTWEFIEVFCKGDLKKSGEKEHIDISDEEFKSWVVAKWSIGPERRMKQFEHPAMFPEDLVERCLKLFSYQGDIVLDPFNGAGTTTLVASRTGRNFYGIDISEEYCKTARSRLAPEKKEWFI